MRIFVNENVAFTVKHLGDKIDSLTITINLKHELQKIAVIYHSPTFAISSFLDLFEKYLIHHLKGAPIVCGDFNIDFLGSQNSRFLSLLIPFNLNLQNHFVTRVSIISGKCIDDIFSDEVLTCNTIGTDISDRYVLLIRAYNSTEENCVAKILYRKLKKLAENEKLCNHLFHIEH